MSQTEFSREKKIPQIENKYFKCSRSLDISQNIKSALRVYYSYYYDEHQEDKWHKKLVSMWERGIFILRWCQLKTGATTMEINRTWAMAQRQTAGQVIA